MPWLTDTDIGAAQLVVRASTGARTEAELRGRALGALGALVPSDVLTWDRVELASGAVTHEVLPVDAEPAGVFAAIVRRADRHPLLAAHAGRRRPALRLAELVDPGPLQHSALYGDLLHASGVEYEIAIAVRTGRGEVVVVGLGRTERDFSARDRDVLDLVRRGLEGAVCATQARGRLTDAETAGPPPGTAVVLVDVDGEIVHAGPSAQRWLAEHFGAAEHPAWLPDAVADWLALPPRPPLVSEHEGRRLTVWLMPGDPHVLLLEEEVARLRDDALRCLGLTARETEVLRAATMIADEAGLAWELALSRHAIRRRLERVEAKLGVRTTADAIATARRASA